MATKINPREVAFQLRELAIACQMKGLRSYEDTLNRAADLVSQPAVASLISWKPQ